MTPHEKLLEDIPIKRLLPTIYFDVDYVEKDTLALLNGLASVFSNFQDELKAIYQSRYFHRNVINSAQDNLWTLENHSKLWDLLDIIPEKEIFLHWLQNNSNKTAEDVNNVHKYCCGLYRQRLSSMLKVLIEGLGTPHAIKEVFCSFFHYKEDSVDIKANIKYILRKNDNLLELTIKHPEKARFDSAHFDQVNFDTANEAKGFELYINSNFNTYDDLPPIEKISAKNLLGDNLNTIRNSFKEIYSTKGRDYFEYLVHAVKAAGVTVKIYYTMPIWKEESPLQTPKSDYWEIFYHLPKESLNLESRDISSFVIEYKIKQNCELSPPQIRGIFLPVEEQNHLQYEVHAHYELDMSLPEQHHKLGYTTYYFDQQQSIFNESYYTNSTSKLYQLSEPYFDKGKFNHAYFQ